MEREEFRPITYFEGRYELSSEGYVIDLVNERRLFRSESVMLQGPNEVWARRYMKRLVADTFIPGDGRNVYHIDGVGTNNRANNLYRCNRRYGNVYRPVRCSNGYDYKTVIEAHIQTGVPVSTIKKMANGSYPRKTFKGYSFSAISEDEADFDWRDGYYFIEHDGKYDGFPEFDGAWKKRSESKKTRSPEEGM